MAFIRNFLALIGLVSIIFVGLVAFQAKEKFKDFDEGAAHVYVKMASILMETNDIAESMVWKVPVEEGVTPEDVETSMLAVAAERNLAITGVFPLGEDIRLKTDKPYRYVKIFTFCRSRVAADMLDYSDAYSSFMPCRIALIEDKQGKYWLYSMDMDPMIYGGAPLPPKLKKDALEIRDIMLDIMHRGAAGEF